MGRHHRQGKWRLTYTVILGITIVSALSPVGLLLLDQPTPQSVEATQAFAITTTPIQESPVVSTKDQPLLSKQPKQQQQQQHTKSTHKPIIKTTPTPKPQPQPQPKSKPQPSPTKTKETPKPVPKPVPKAEVKTTNEPKAKVSTNPRPTTSTTQRVVPQPTTTVVATKSTPPSTQTSSLGKVVDVAKRYVGLGIPYRMGGNSVTGGMDCSHFVWTVFKEAGYSYTYRDSAGLASWAQRTKDPKPGDLVLYSGHVGIYAGNGMMVHHGRDGGAFFVKVYTQNLIGYGKVPL